MNKQTEIKMMRLEDVIISRWSIAKWFPTALQANTLQYISPCSYLMVKIVSLFHLLNPLVAWWLHQHDDLLFVFSFDCERNCCGIFNVCPLRCLYLVPLKHLNSKYVMLSDSMEQICFKRTHIVKMIGSCKV